MNKLSFAISATLLVLLAGLSSCEAIGGIFKAGIWTGVIGIAIIVFIILWLIGRSRK
jgi:hypothetical protein